MTTPLARVTERVNRGGDVNDGATPTPLLTLEESPETVWSWFPEGLRPDETWAGWPAEQRFEPYAPPPGTQPVACWWD